MMLCINDDDKCTLHYNDVIMGAVASQIASLTVVYSTVDSDADQRKCQSSASLAFVRGIHRGPVNSPHKWPVTRKMFPFDDVILIDQWTHKGHTHSSSSRASCGVNMLDKYIIIWAHNLEPTICLISMFQMVFYIFPKSPSTLFFHRHNLDSFCIKKFDCVLMVHHILILCCRSWCQLHLNIGTDDLDIKSCHNGVSFVSVNGVTSISCQIKLPFDEITCKCNGAFHDGTLFGILFIWGAVNYSYCIYSQFIFIHKMFVRQNQMKLYYQ